MEAQEKSGREVEVGGRRSRKEKEINFLLKKNQGWKERRWIQSEKAEWIDSRTMTGRKGGISN